MSRKMTVVFHDEGLYTDLKVEAAKRHKPASEIVAESVREWLEAQEDAELLPIVEAATKEWEEKGGRPWAQAEADLRKGTRRRPRASRARSV